MQKASENITGEYNDIFSRRLEMLMRDGDVTQQKLADYCGVRRQSIAQWKDGKTNPDIISLRKVAEFFHVSTDYLLGLSDTASLSLNVQEIVKLTGISEENVKFMLDLSNKGEKLRFILSQGISDGIDFITKTGSKTITDYEGLMEALNTPPCTDVSSDKEWKNQMMLDDMLSQRGYVVLTGEEAFEHWCLNLGEDYKNFLMEKYRTAAEWYQPPEKGVPENGQH